MRSRPDTVRVNDFWNVPALAGIFMIAGALYLSTQDISAGQTMQFLYEQPAVLPAASVMGGIGFLIQDKVVNPLMDPMFSSL